MATLPEEVDPPDSSRSSLEASGWTQFSFLQPGDHQACLDGVAPDPRRACRWIAVSHACDIACHASKEPLVEFMPVVEVATGVPTPRQFFFRAWRIPDKTPIVLSGRASESVKVLKIRLEQGALAPAADLTLADPRLPATLRPYSEVAFAEWLKRRYDRPFVPTEFDRRLRGKRGKILKCLARIMTICCPLEMRIAITPPGEIERSEGYEIRVWALIPAGEETVRTKLQGEMNTLGTFLGTGTGVRVIDCSAKSFDELFYFTTAQMLPFEALVEQWDVPDAVSNDSASG